MNIHHAQPGNEMMKTATLNTLSSRSAGQIYDEDGYLKIYHAQIDSLLGWI